MHRSLALDAGQVVRLDRARRGRLSAHGPRSPPGTGRARVEGAVEADEVDLLGAQPPEPAGQRGGVGRLHRPVAAVAAAVVGGAERPAAGVGDRSEAGRAVGDHDAHVAAALALDAHAARRDGRPALVEEGADHLEELALVDRAAVQLEVHVHVVRDRRRGRRASRRTRARRRPPRGSPRRRRSCAAPGCRPPWRRPRSSRACATARAPPDPLARPPAVVIEPSTSERS